MSKPSMSELTALFSQVEKVHGVCARGKATSEQIDASEKALGVRIQVHSRNGFDLQTD